jgi:hypothetical protein
MTNARRHRSAQKASHSHADERLHLIVNLHAAKYRTGCPNCHSSAVPQALEGQRNHDGTLHPDAEKHTMKNHFHIGI